MVVFALVGGIIRQPGAGTRTLSLEWPVRERQ